MNHVQKLDFWVYPKEQLCDFVRRVRVQTGRDRFRQTGKSDARKWPTSAAGPHSHWLKVKDCHSTSMECFLKSPMILVLLTGTCPHLSSGTSRHEFSILLLSLYFYSYLDHLWLLRVFSHISTAWLSSQIDPFRFSDICSSCHQLATCVAQNGSNAGCFCKHGYTGDGTTFCDGEYKCFEPSSHGGLFKVDCCSLLSTESVASAFSPGLIEEHLLIKIAICQVGLF